MWENQSLCMFLNVCVCVCVCVRARARKDCVYTFMLGESLADEVRSALLLMAWLSIERNSHYDMNRR